MKFVAWSALVIGVLMILQWGFFILTGQVPELQTEPVRIAFHLAAEAVTAVTLIIAGIWLLHNKAGAYSLALVGFGMLIYTVIISPGYFAQNGAWPLVAMFGVLLVLALVSVVMIAKLQRGNEP